MRILVAGLLALLTSSCGPPPLERVYVAPTTTFAALQQGTIVVFPTTRAAGVPGQEEQTVHEAAMTVVGSLQRARPAFRIVALESIGGSANGAHEQGAMAAFTAGGGPDAGLARLLGASLPAGTRYVVLSCLDTYAESRSIAKPSPRLEPPTQSPGVLETRSVVQGRVGIWDVTTGERAWECSDTLEIVAKAEIRRSGGAVSPGDYPPAPGLWPTARSLFDRLGANLPRRD